MELHHNEIPFFLVTLNDRRRRYRRLCANVFSVWFTLSVNEAQKCILEQPRAQERVRHQSVALSDVSCIVLSVT